MIETQAPIYEDKFRNEVMDKLNLSEETLNKINQLHAGHETLGLVSGDFDFEFPVVNGHGQQNIKSFTNPFPWDLTADVTAKILSPLTGTWRVRILVGNNVILDQSGIKPNQTVDAKATIPGWSTVQVSGEVWWSENGNTTLEVHGHYSV
jgi:hypothetical protein